jgi:hypothetical protein
MACSQLVLKYPAQLAAPPPVTPTLADPLAVTPPLANPPPVTPGTLHDPLAYAVEEERELDRLGDVVVHASLQAIRTVACHESLTDSAHHVIDTHREPWLLESHGIL